MTFNVRRASTEDLEKLIGFIISEAAEAEGIDKSSEKVREGIHTALKDESVALYWILENNKEAIGNISVVKEWSDWNAGYYWWIQSIYIEPEYRGQGLINLLLKAVKDSAIENRALDIRLYVHKNNERAIKAYLKSGFANSDYRVMIMGI